ncbi:hypothetical protein J6590_074969 [Homalodisca vitripennis]|nr:hypothetical protein J6590_074969 [Homalodisca vitripennis]
MDRIIAAGAPYVSGLAGVSSESSDCEIYVDVDLSSKVLIDYIVSSTILFYHGSCQ